MVRICGKFITCKSVIRFYSYWFIYRLCAKYIGYTELNDKLLSGLNQEKGSAYTSTLPLFTLQNQIK
jgi:hypothetical protein